MNPSTKPAANAPPMVPAKMTGIPVDSAKQYYPPSDAATFAPLHLQSQTPGPWSTGLCDCFDDVGNCCITFFCPCITFGQIAEIVDQGSTSCGVSGVLYGLLMYITGGCACLYSCYYRSRLRRQYALPGSPFADCLVHCFCEHCALCQEYRELKNRGFDMYIGGSAMICEVNRSRVVILSS